MQKSAKRLTTPSPGEVLKRYRIENEIDIDDIAGGLFLSVNQVQYLENGEYDKLPGATYIIGYWRSYANLLDVDISENIESHRAKLEKSPSNIALDLNHQRDHGHKEKSRKKSAVIFCILSALFLAGIWYWQSPEEKSANLWNNSRTTKQLSDNSASAEAGNLVQSQRSGSEVIFLDEKESTIALPVPNFSDDFGSQSETPKTENLGVDYEQSLFVVGNLPDSDAVVLKNNSQENADKIEAVTGAESGESSEIQGDKLLAIEPVVSQSEETQPEASSSNAITQNASATSVEIQEANQLPKVKSSSNSTSNANIQTQESKPDKKSESVENLQSDTEWSADSPEWIIFKAQSESWLDVRDRQGGKLVYRIVEAGETLKIKGAPPFLVFMGTANGINVEYLGQAVEFSPHKSGNFSRFQVGKRQ